MAINVVFETHATTEDNERGIATGWLPGQLSAVGRRQAEELGERRRDDGIAAVFCSDLARAVETVSIAFAGTTTPRLLDWRLRECDYGERNGQPLAEVHAGGKSSYLEEPYPRGESWREAIARVGRFLSDLPTRWESARVLVVGHVATKWALEHLLAGVPLEQLAAEEFQWRPGWDYRIT